MKRYDYLIDKQQRKCKEGKRLSKEEHEELRLLRPNVFTPILMMFELLYDTVKTNQEYRVQTSRPKTRINQTGGAVEVASAPPLDNDNGKNTAETKRLSELEESLLPLLTKIIMYIELNNKKQKGKVDADSQEEDEKYPDIGTSAKNSAILVVRRIKKWWNDLIAGGTSDLSSKINLKKAIPQLPNNPDDMNNMNEMNELVNKATDAIDGPLKKIEKILSNDVRDIASSSVEGIMNALSLIPGIGTTLQLWRLLQNVIVIMSKSVSTMAQTKVAGSGLKERVQGIQADFQNMATNPEAIAAAAAKGLTSQISGGLAGAGAGAAGNIANMAQQALGSAAGGAAGNITNMAQQALGSAAGGAAGNITNMAQQALGSAAGGAAGNIANMAQQALGSAGGAAAGNIANMAQKAMTQQGGGHKIKTNHIRSIKNYKREYKQSIRDIQKTRKNILRLIKNMV
jgi:hypothetical protein